MAQVQPVQAAGAGELSGPAKEVMDSTNGNLVKQKFKLVEAFYDRQNKYKLTDLPDGWNSEIGWDEELYDSMSQTITIQEESECFDRVCCVGPGFGQGIHRNLTLHVTKGKNKWGDKDGYEELFTMHRPFVVPCMAPCPCLPLMLTCKPEITTYNTQGQELGKVRQDHRFVDYMLGKQYWLVEDGAGQTKYEIASDQCCNANMCAPSFCFPKRSFEIRVTEGDIGVGEPVGSIDNLFACSMKRMCLPALDQYKIEYPADASAEDKALLLSGLMLLEYQLFEARPDDSMSEGD